MKTLINNFCGGHPIAVGTNACSNEDLEATVCITQRHGALSFQHDMTPAQAREMAAVLIACADELDALPDALPVAQEEEVAA